MSLHRRARLLNHQQRVQEGIIIYWMSRDQRLHDNHALLFAQQQARQNNGEVCIVFTMADNYIHTHQRNIDFMLHGLHEIRTEARRYGFPFLILKGNPAKELGTLIANHPVACLVSDFDPLRIKNQWKESLNQSLTIPFYEVDTHNIIPPWIVSNKQEYGAYTIRPKIHRLLIDYLTEPEKLTHNHSTRLQTETLASYSTLPVKKPLPSHLPKPGNKAAHEQLHSFIKKRLPIYDQQRNDPNAQATSGLSPYLHFGQISSLRIALDIIQAGLDPALTGSFLEELIVRKELSDNYCLYNHDYDTLSHIPQWAKITLEKHARDEREYLYTYQEFEEANTHDPLWNAAQQELLVSGKIHSYMRMYWAKKILEWSSSPEEALRISIGLNDFYALDGRDPNGYVGCAWSIAGVHDRAWTERPVFGKIRYMNNKGCQRKFDVTAYIKQVNNRL